jgi:iron complex outermembrane receptor protein
MLVAGALRPVSLFAQDGSATVHGVREAERVEGGTRFATAIDLRARGTLAESMGDLLDEAPGLHVRRMGDGFAPQSLTLRGAPGAHLTVALDGVVLNDAASDGVDLALVPPALVERADVYRGGAPLRLGVSGLGGALELVTRRPLGAGTIARMAGGYGSFGARRATASVGHGRALVALGYRGTDGDFPYYDGSATPRLGGVVRIRNNNASEAVDVLARACAGSDGALGPCVSLVVGWREREVAGPGSHPSDGPVLTQHRALVRGTVPWRFTRHRGELWAAAILRRDVFANVGPVPLYGSTPYVARATNATFELGGTGTFAARTVSFEPVLRLRREGFAGSTQSEGALSVVRWSGLLGLEGEVRGGALRVVPGVGVEVLSDAGAAEARVQGLWTARLGASWRPVRWFELRANGGWFERAPTLPELYGDRGFVRGNAALRPEQAINVDAGAVLHGTGALGRWRLELVGYVRDVRDLIAFVQVNRASFRAYNVSAAVVRGLEAQGRFAWGRHVALVVSYALTDARAAEGVPVLGGRRVPGVPMHDLFMAVTGRWAHRCVGSLALRTDVSFVSEAWLEETNLETLVVPARTLLGASLTWEPSFARRLSLSVTASNLLDLRTVERSLPGGSVVSPVLDFLGYPLPGRSLLAAVTVSTEEAP